jgi:hypothetical protein
MREILLLRQPRLNLRCGSMCNCVAYLVCHSDQACKVQKGHLFREFMSLHHVYIRYVLHVSSSPTIQPATQAPLRPLFLAGSIAHIFFSLHQALAIICTLWYCNSDQDGVRIVSKLALPPHLYHPPPPQHPLGAILVHLPHLANRPHDAMLHEIPHWKLV